MSPGPPVRRRRWRRWLLLLPLLLPLLAEGIYFIAANRYLRSESFTARLNAPRRKLRLRFGEISTPFPGRFHARDIELRGRTRALDWWLRADAASGWLDLPALRERRIALTSGDASGLTLYLRRREHASSSPELEAALPVLPETDIVADGSPPASSRPRWRFELGHWRFEDVRELWLEQLRITGQIRVSGGLEVRPGETFEVRPSRLIINSGAIDIGAAPAARELEGELALALAPLNYKEEKRWDIVPYLRGRADLHGRLADLSFLDRSLGKLGWLDLRGGDGPFRLAVRLRDGQLEPGSALELAERALEVHLLGYEARGTGAVQWLVERDAAGARLAVALPELEVRRAGESEAYLEGKGFAVLAQTQDRIVDGSVGLRSIDVLLEKGTVRDLRAYNSYLPAKAGVSIRGGSATVSARLASPDLRGGHGEILLSAPDARFDLGGLDVAGKLELAARLETDDLRGRRFELDGTTLRLTNASVHGGAEPRGGWWGHVDLRDGWTSPLRSPYFSATVETTLRDSGPLLDFLTTRKKLPGVLRDLLNVENLSGRASLTLSPRMLDVRGLAVRAGKLGLDADLRLAHGTKTGALLAQYGRLAVGLELEDGERDWILLRPRHWWQKQTGRQSLIVSDSTSDEP